MFFDTQENNNITSTKCKLFTPNRYNGVQTKRPITGTSIKSLDGRKVTSVGTTKADQRAAAALCLPTECD